jgi:putative two-component system response regulator
MEKRGTVVLVDDSVTNLQVGKNILAEHYNVFTVPSAEKMFQLLTKIKPNLILLDVEMPVTDGYEAIKKLKENETLKEIPVVFLTAKSDVKSEINGFDLGAVDYISKPFSPILFLRRIEVHMLVEKQKNELKRFNTNLQEIVAEKTKTIVQLQNSIIRTVADLVESRDDVTGGHIERTQHYLQLLTEGLIAARVYDTELKGINRKLLIQSSQLHDVGKISISDNILLKPGKLTPEEYGKMKLHTVYGGQIIDRIAENVPTNDFLKFAKIFALTHHEKWDGSGYPNKLAGEEIPLVGRIMAFADVYDALTAERPYKDPFPHEKAVSIIMDGKGSHFDPKIADAFYKMHKYFDKTKQKI